MTIRKPFAVIPLPLGNITTGNARTNRPASHLGLTQHAGMRWQSNGNGNLWVRGQFDTIRAVNFAALMGTNAQLGTTIRVRLGMSQEQVDGAALYDSGAQPLIAPLVTRSDGVYHSHLEIPVVQNAFWWRIDIGGHAGDFAASALIFGEKREPSHFYNRGREIGFQDLGALEIGRNGVVAETPGALLRTLLFRLQWVSDDEFKRVWSPMMEVKGKRQVTYLCFDPQADENRQDVTFLGFMTADLFKRGNDFPLANQMDFQFQALDFRTGPALPLAISPAASTEPSLLLDFASLDTVFVRGPSDAQLRPRAFSPFTTFTRASTATRINAAGLVESVANNVPRLDYDPVTLQPRGLLIESARTNLLLRSAEFDNASWTKSGGGTGIAPVVTANAATAPDGTVTADQIVFNVGSGTTTNDQSVIQQGAGTNGIFTVSIWLRADSPVTLLVRNPGNNGPYTSLSVTTQWQRFEVSDGLTTVSSLLQFGLRRGIGVTFPDTVTVFAWGAQSEAGAYATSYIPTAGSTVARAADVASITGTAFSDWYRQGEGTFLVEGFIPPTRDSVSGNYYFDVSDGTTGNRISVLESNGSRGQILTATVLQFDSTVGTKPVVPVKIAAGYRGNDARLAVNGALGLADNALTVPAVDRLTIGIRGDLATGTIADGHIRSIRYWPTRLSDAQLQALTA